MELRMKDSSKIPSWKLLQAEREGSGRFYETFYLNNQKSMLCCIAVAIFLLTFGMTSLMVPFPDWELPKFRSGALPQVQCNQTSKIEIKHEERIPFYMYNPNNFTGFVNCMEYIDEYTNAKFDTDIQLILALARHPWRVYDIRDAKIAIVPVLWDRIARKSCEGSSDTHMENMKKIIAKNYNSHGIRHLVFANDWKTKYIVQKLRSHFKRMLIGTKLHRQNETCRFGIGFSTNYANWHLWGIQDYVYSMPKPHSEREYFVSFIGQLDRRLGYRDRYELFHKELQVEIPNSFIVTPSVHHGIRKCKNDMDSDRCQRTKFSRGISQEVAMNSNFSLALRGDDEGGDRFQNAFIAGAILVAVIEDFELDVGWLPFPDFIPWKDIVITIPRNKFQANPASEVNKLREIPEHELQKKRELMKLYAATIDVEYAGGYEYVKLILKTAAVTSCR